ncbi:MAG: 2-succinyl-5-enolpyruvyl-6-hydroxy-3-cyclohexene-1-carboxylic-acid synthase [Prevotella sp.]|nr:2-succinyl-5-enolpyruvyl-6-hydroxy-3-cyclohexene-1-carboxylic-acid synthase [Prevotella sp.]
MYSNKENVNILTSLLVSHGIRHAVVCPGSRNAPIVHNLNECPDITCHPVTDERSAAFCALGMCQELGAPVVVCVTSGTALLNTAPAVAEAYYQQQPVVVISADRPPQWIDQQDGQTLPQPDALGRFVRKAVSLPEPRNSEERWYCNRLINEALLATRQPVCGPVHINVPISEPLFEFGVVTLPVERTIETVAVAPAPCHALLDALSRASRPMVVVGQMASVPEELAYLSELAVVLSEPLSAATCPPFDEVLYRLGDDARYLPDFILYLGGSIVSKRLKKFLRRAVEADGWRVSADGCVEDTFMQLRHVVTASPADLLAAMHRDLTFLSLSPAAEDYRQLWHEALTATSRCREDYRPRYSQMAAVQYFEGQVARLSSEPVVHYANSSSVRLAAVYARHHVRCNRGVNGIEGSLSTAVGCSCVTRRQVYCVIGDLSFFYDQNALWNQQLRGNLRILLLNNGRGGIFNLLPGLEQSSARDPYVAAAHHTSAEGICRQHDIVYLQAYSQEEMEEQIDTLLYMESDRPVLLEVFTDVAADEQAYRSYYQNGIKEF